MTGADITVVSIYATDRIYDAAGNWICNQEGGPCLFIAAALKEQKVSYQTLAPTKKALLDIKLEKTGERGTVRFVPTLEIDWSSITSPYLLISTLFDEISLANIDLYNGNICIDVQGFVRKVRSDKKTIWNIPDNLYKNCFCLKATEEELKYIPKEFIQKQKQNLLIVTKGSNGVEYWEKGKCKEVFPKEIIACSDTLGAGDTFFANIIADLSRNQSVDVAIKNSLQITSNFLKKKPKQIAC